MNRPKSEQSFMQHHRLFGLVLALLIVPGCGTGDPGDTLQTLAADLARQLVTWWLL